MSSSLLLRAGSVLAAAAIALPVAACGSGSSSSSDGSGDPAHALPASTPVYIEARVHQSGDLKANVEAVARKLLRTDDPGQKITDLINQGFKDDHRDFKKDVEPWLGDRAGVGVTSLTTGSDSPAIVAVASKDDDKAKDYINSHKGAVKRTYRGVDYRYDAKEETAGAVLDHMVLIGDEAALKSAIDVNKGAARLSDAKNFKEARTQVSGASVGFLYLDPARLFDSLAASGGGNPQQAQVLKGLIGGSGLRSIVAALEVEQNALRVNAAVIGVKSPKGSGDGPGAAADVPADAWLSLGIGDVGGKVQQALDQVGKSGAIPGLDPATLIAQLKSQLGVDVQKDFLSWMGDTAVFVRGTSLQDLGGAVVIHSKDPAASQRAVGILRRLLPQMGAKAKTLHADGLTGLRIGVGATGGEIDIAAKGDRFVIAYGRDALAAAFGGGQSLGDTDAYKTAQGLLGGEKASLFLDTPQVVQLIGSAVSDPAGFAKAKPTLDAFGPAAAGASTAGDVMHIKFAVQVK